MSDVVIKAEGLGKKYLIGHQRETERYTALRDVLARSVKGMLHKTRQVFSGQQLLAGNEIVGHVDPKADREKGKLRVVSRRVRRGHKIAGALAQLAGFLGLK